MSADSRRSARASGEAYPFRRKDAQIQLSCQMRTVNGDDIDDSVPFQSRVPSSGEFVAAPVKKTENINKFRFFFDTR